MKKKHVIPALLFSVTTSFSLLSFSACNTTENSNIENSSPPAMEEEYEGQDSKIDTGNADTVYNDQKNSDGIQPKRGTLIDDIDTSRKK